MFTPEMSYNEMVARFNELVATSYEYLKAIYFKKEEETKEAVRAYKTAMSNLGYTEEQMKDCLSTEDLPEGFPHQEILALPETTQKVDEEATTVAEPISITPVSVEQEEETLSSLEDLLSDDPRYKAFYAPEHPEKENHRSLPTLDELLSDEPINRILNLGNELPKGAPYRQNNRICHAKGMIPTETATGQTLVYVPQVNPVLA